MNRAKRGLWGWALALGLLGAGVVEGLGAKAFGDLTMRATLTPTGVSFSPGFTGTYFSGLVADLPRSTLASIPALAENVLVSTGSGFQLVLPSPGGTSFVQLCGYLKEDVVMNWPVGVVGAVAELGFSWDGRRRYLWTHGWVHYAGVELRVKMSLARVDAAVGSGLEFGFEGTTLRGLALSIASQYGLTADRAALLRAVTQGQVAGEMFLYRGTTLTAGVIPFCCVSLAATVRLAKAGFESAQIATAYTFTCAEVSVIATATALFKTGEKTVTIVPRLVLPGTGSELYLSCSLVPPTLGPGSPAITGIRLDEAGLSGVRLGEVTAGARYSFAENVYRGSLTGLPRYDLAFSLRRTTLDTQLAVDLYFAAEGAYVFGLGLVTFQAQVTLLGDFVLGLSADFTTDTGWRRLLLDLNYAFNLYGL